MANHNLTRYKSLYDETENLVLALTLFVIIFMSVIGNIIILVTLYKNKKMWISTNILIGNLAISSLIVTIIVMPFSLYSAATGEWTFKEGPVCGLTGFFASLLLLATIFTHTAISIDKFFGVVKPLSRAITPRKTLVMLAVIWGIASMMTIGPLVGISRFEYNPTTLICGVGFPKSSADVIYLGLLATLGFVVPNMIMTYAYVRVYISVRQQARRLLEHAIVSHEVLQLQKRIILTVFFSLVCFMLCWTPFCILTLLAVKLKDSSQLPRGLGVAAYWTGYFNSALNPIIICSMSARFKEGLLNMLRCITTCPLVLVNICRNQRQKNNGKTQEHLSNPCFGSNNKKNSSSNTEFSMLPVGSEKMSSSV